MTVFSQEQAPDLLRRFVATDFKRIVGGCTLESNDVALLDATEKARVDVPAGYQLRIVRDDEPLHLTAPARIICTGALFLFLTGGTVVMVDNEQRCAFAFVSPEISPEDFARRDLPAAFGHAASPRDQG